MSDLQQFVSDSPISLESGQSLSSFTLTYATYGSLNHDKTNAILLCHALSGDAQVSGKRGWWKDIVGKGTSIDTDRYFVVCINSLGSCYGSSGPASINPLSGRPYGTSFPVITIGDMVVSQYAVMETLGIPKWAAVIGPSMGGMQALEWSIMFPDLVDQCIPIATTHRLSTSALAYGAIGRNAIISDPQWNNGEYSNETSPKKGLGIARMIGHITYLSHDSLDTRFGRRLQEKNDYSYDFSTDFQIESYLTHQGNKFVDRFDANAYLYLSKAMSYFDLGKKYGSLSRAMAKSKADFLFMSISSDSLYSSRQSKEIAKTLMRLNRHANFVEIDSTHGHDGFLIESEKINRVLSSYLGNRLCH
jgi:homoserine O-acetyltransferase